MDLTLDRKTVGACLQQKFTLPTYQREYRWESKHLQELLSDIQDEFMQNYKPEHGRKEVGGYSPYFLGTIITTDAGDGARAIIDGQQRITTLTIILAYFLRESKRKPDLLISNIEPSLRKNVFGASEFNLEFDTDRYALFELLLDSTEIDGPDLEEAVDGIHGITDSTRGVFSIFSIIETFLLDEIKLDLCSRFVDYLTERVYLFEIGVPSEQDGHKVFVTMNDRGLKLAPIDLLKGFLLSNISEGNRNLQANATWSQCIRDLRTIGKDEDSTFFKTWLRAQYAVSTRGKSRGDAPGDFEIVGDAYHRWVVDKAGLLGLKTSDDYFRLVDKVIPFFVKQYIRISDSEKIFDEKFPYIYYNGTKNLTLQYMAILSAIKIEDTPSVVDSKINIVSYYIDCLATARVITGKDNNYDNVKDIIFAFAKSIRGKTIEELIQITAKLTSDMAPEISSIVDLNYERIRKRQDLLHILARIASYLEDGVEQTNRVGFAGYVDRLRGARTFDIEHVIPNYSFTPIDPEDGPNLSKSISELKEHLDTHQWRSSIGALVLLPRGRNRSLQDKKYSHKTKIYATENVLAQTLTEAFYVNNPCVTTFLKSSGLPLRPIIDFDKMALDERSELYRKIALEIWGSVPS